MRRQAIRLVLLASSAAVLVCAGNLPERWRAWHYSRAVLQNSSSPDGSEATMPAQTRLPWEMFAHCNAGCSDVRVVDGRGQEISYELRAGRAMSRFESHEVQIVENSFAAGKYTQVVGDLGSDPPFCDRVRVETNFSDFIVWVEVALSDDAKTWRIVEPRAPIARFRKRSVDGTQTAPFAGLKSRYIRLRIFETEQQFSVAGLTVLREETHAATLAEVPASFQLTNSDDTTETARIANLASSNIPLTRVQFAADTPEFYRAVRISGSEDGKIWNYRGSGVIYRYKQGAAIRESLAVDFQQWPGNRLLRVDIINGNDQPLRNANLSLFAVPFTLAFRLQPDTSYRVVYGNERAGSPQYDLSHYLEAGATKTAYRELSLGPEEATANYLDPRPFSERHPSVLWLALAIALVLIGLTALKTLRTPSQPPSDNPS